MNGIEMLAGKNDTARRDIIPAGPFIESLRCAVRSAIAAASTIAAAVAGRAAAVATWTSATITARSAAAIAAAATTAAAAISAILTDFHSLGDCKKRLTAQ